MISSASNPKLKHIRALLTDKKARDTAQQFVLENERFILDTLNNHPTAIDSLFYTHNTPDHLLDLATANAIFCTDVAPDLFAKLHSVKTSCGIIAIVKKPTPTYPKTLSKAVFLDQINKPQNLGAIIRSAAAFSLDAVFLSPKSCDPFHPDSIRAMAGHCFHIPIIQDTLPNLLKRYPNTSLYRLSEKAEHSLFETKFNPSSLILFGSETGFSEYSDTNHPHSISLKIPIHPAIDSLNVAVTAGIAFAHLSQNAL